MATSRLARGRPVAYRGDDTGRDILGAGTRPRLLYCGHPGRITDATVQHILVDWVGLEDESLLATGQPAWCFQFERSSLHLHGCFEPETPE